MKKVLILANNDGGLYHFRRELLESLIGNGYEVIISVPEGKYREQIEAIGCRYIPTPIDRHGMNPVKDGMLFIKYGKMIKKHTPDVVLTYTIKPNVYGALQARLRKVPYIVNITGLGTALQKKGIVQKVLITLYRLSLAKASCVFFQNEQNLKFMEENGCIKTATKLIPGSGVNIKEFSYVAYPSADMPVRILNITRIMKDKGIEEFLDAAEKIKKKYPEIIFELVGDYEPDERELYEPWINALQKEDIVKYYGYQKDVKPFIERSHLVVNPTYHEGMSNVLQEAAASGRPVAASDISGCREIFEDGEGGIAFAVQNAEALEWAIDKFVKMNYTEKSNMGKKARDYIERFFDRRIVIQAYMDAINTIEKRL